MSTGFTSLGDVFERIKATRNININMTPEEMAQQKVKWYNDAEGNLNDIDGYNCELCKNKGDIARLDENGNEVHTLCKCRKIRATLRRAQRSGLGNIITEYTFDKFKDEEEWQQTIKRKALAFCADKNAKWFYIGGQVGSGKSHICTAVAAHYIKAGHEVRYMVWAEESKKLKAVVNDESYQDMMNELKNVDVLYIDDFLKVKYGENPTTADINLAFEIINHRLIDGDKITIISSEKMLDEIMEYDEATMSRIYQKTGDYKLSIGKDRTKNYRLRG